MGYRDDTQDLNPLWFPPNLRHLEKFSSPVTSPGTAPVPGSTQHQTCQDRFFQTPPAFPAAPESHLTAPACQRRRVSPHLPFLPTQEPALSLVEGYSQLRANFSGPDAVEWVLQLHSPAKRRENTELLQKPTSSESPGKKKPLPPGKSRSRRFPL